MLDLISPDAPPNKPGLYSQWSQPLLIGDIDFNPNPSYLLTETLPLPWQLHPPPRSASPSTQAEPVWLDLDATVDKTCALIAEAASQGAQLIAFPECLCISQASISHTGAILTLRRKIKATHMERTDFVRRRVRRVSRQRRGHAARPDGRLLSELIPPTEEGIIYADLDQDEIDKAKAFVDVVGHYSWPDLLWLGVGAKDRRHLRDDEGKTLESGSGASR
ncbi:hypothetical protein BO82DRAFT_366011 [Aspergillus uvarum CBS 121591]|uniref:nitrilase n=1 Tax=Aspergillus uvarum CBS 121591 TaxID=1448315 RepID=A0A319CX50_9EURO|nr:hypothetical protein BO82DRAFT_366011 [Aspergillus uvarum CBS 121591]PYH80218.1 hypothetical protein BO82DRAFT_366011 [Aspergillus uvarum CBS 121591]